MLNSKLQNEKASESAPVKESIKPSARNTPIVMVKVLRPKEQEAKS